MSASTPSGPLLRVEGARVVYRRRGRAPLAAVDGVDLEVAAGEVVGLVGESGCGKSTLARAICGLEPLADGGIALRGAAVRRLGLRRRREPDLAVQMVFQNPYASLNPRRRVGAQIGDARRLVAGGGEPVAALLEQVGLPAAAADRYPHEFSGGQRQRIAIARAMAARPALLIGDEPIASLDASLQSRVAALMRDVALTRGAGLLFISHDLAVVRAIADRIVVMRAGRVVEQGDAARVWSAPREEYTRRLLAAIPVADGLGRLPEG